MGSSKDIEGLMGVLSRALAEVAEVRAGYLFGSRAYGAARPDSDLDVAVKLAAHMDDTARGRAKLAIIEVLTRELGALGERADVVDLERANPTVAFRAIRDGACVLERDRAERVRLEAFVARRYDDERPHRELARKAAVVAAERMAGDRA